MKHVFICDSRFKRDATGSLFTKVGHFGGDGWRRDLDSSINLALVGRVERVDCSLGDGFFPVNVDNFNSLPNFTGLYGFISNFHRLLIQLWRAIGEADVVVVRVPSGTSVLAAFIASVRRRPLAGEVVGDAAAVLQVGGAGRLGRLLSPLLNSVVRWTVRRLGVVRYMTRGYLQKLYPPAPDAVAVGCSSIVLAGDWFDDEWMAHPDQREAALVAVGSMENGYKGHDVLIQAIAKLNQRASGRVVTLTLVGEGRIRSQLESLASELGQANNVVFAGYVGDRARLREILLRSDIFVIPSLTEGLPRSLVEAMSLGMPCLGSSVGGVPELLDDDSLFKPGDVDDCARSISSMLDRMERTAEVSERNRAKAREYTLDALSGEKKRWSDAVKRLGSDGRD